MSAIREVMTDAPVTVSPDTTIEQCAKAMRDDDIGDVIVAENGELRGIVTDRDIVVRGIAAGKNPASTAVREVCSDELITVKPDDDQEKAVDLMRKKAVRRLPVVEDGNRIVGVLSIGDLAVERDPNSALADISEARANN